MWYEGNLKVLMEQNFQIIPTAALKKNCLTCWKLYEKINTTVMSEKYEATASRCFDLDWKQAETGTQAASKGNKICTIDTVDLSWVYICDGMNVSHWKVADYWVFPQLA